MSLRSTPTRGVRPPIRTSTTSTQKKMQLSKSMAEAVVGPAHQQRRRRRRRAAAGNKMRSQINGTDQGTERNAMDGISLVQTADRRRLQREHSILQRVSELAVQEERQALAPPPPPPPPIGRTPPRSTEGRQLTAELDPPSAQQPHSFNRPGGCSTARFTHAGRRELRLRATQIGLSLASIDSRARQRASAADIRDRHSITSVSKRPLDPGPVQKPPGARRQQPRVYQEKSTPPSPASARRH